MSPPMGRPEPEPDRWIGLLLALISTLMIGTSFIVKKRGLQIAERTGVSATHGGYAYLREPIWWAGMSTMIVGELCNFAAYAFAPAVLVTPLGALSIIVSAVLAHIVLGEKLHPLGMVGCLLCMLGSVSIILHAPVEEDPETILEVWGMINQTSFLVYLVLATALALFLIYWVAPKHGTTNILVFLAICSLIGSISVQSCKALGIALKLTLSGDNQLIYAPTYAFAIVVAVSVVTQMNYLNRSLNTFNTAYVSPVYYVLFTSLVIFASALMYHEWEYLETWDILSIIGGFHITIAGLILLKTTEGIDPSTPIRELYWSHCALRSDDEHMLEDNTEDSLIDDKFRVASID